MCTVEDVPAALHICRLTEEEAVSDDLRRHLEPAGGDGGWDGYESHESASSYESYEPYEYESYESHEYMSSSGAPVSMPSLAIVWMSATLMALS